MSVNTVQKGQHHWDLHGNTHDDCILAVLCVIRDELKQLNLLLHCPNFTGIPHTLTAIKRNTIKPRKLKAK